MAVFYIAYSAVRNRFGSAVVDPIRAYDNAMAILDVERSMGLFVEQRLQDLVVVHHGLIWILNVFYGTFHFVVTGGVLIWLFVRRPDIYRRWRNALAATTGLAIVGFSLFPVMPPRLLGDCGPYGACAQPVFVDTIAEVGGLWSFDSGAMASVSNQYAAVPSLHIAWALWCALVVLPLARNRFVRALIVGYPILTLLTIVVTANHFWIDAVLGAATLGLGVAIAFGVERLLRQSATTPGSHREVASGADVPELDPDSTGRMARYRS